MILLKDIAPAAENNIETKFILLDKGRVIVEGQHKTCLAFVADETASVHFQLWGDECDAFEAGDIIDLSNGIFSKQRNNLVLRAGKRGKIMKIGEFTMSFVETPNMSEIHWVPDPTNSKKYIQGHVISTHSRRPLLLYDGTVALSLPGCWASMLGDSDLRKKDGSNSNSSRTSPSKIEDAESVNSLLATENDNLDFKATSPSLEVLSLKPSCDAMLDQRKSDRTSYEPKETMPKENGGNGCVKMQHSQKADSGSSSSVHPVRSIEDENLDYDSNASSSSFEFDKGERHVSNPATRFLFRPMPSKWNNAQKWIMSRQSPHKNITTGDFIPSKAKRRDREEISESERKKKAIVTTIDENPRMVNFMLMITAELDNLTNLQPQGGCDDANFSYLFKTKILNCNTRTIFMQLVVMPGISFVAMRDMGTEMTHVPSQEPSRTATPGGSTTPLCSPTSSMPSTPRRNAPAPTPLDNTTDEDSQFENNKRQLSEEEMLQKMRREIATLGVQLGKINIAARASKNE
ncbi:unnamed protein product [Lupinus luteus]|uniref:Uncharacterized protein n=1 Tax=Lupinus luteus TaxID=3873 RepID=A0AAV1XUC1_LUPLU